MKSKSAPKKKQHYVDNQEFLAAIVKYRKIDLAKAKGLPKPRRNYIGGCFLKIFPIIQTNFIHV